MQCDFAGDIFILHEQLFFGFGFFALRSSIKQRGVRSASVASAKCDRR